MRGTAVLALAIAAAAAADNTPGPRARLVGERLLLARCSSCHSPQRVFHRRASRDEWREIVNRMARMPQSGIAPPDARAILDYLASSEARHETIGGRHAFGSSWLSILEVATVKKQRAKLGGVVYQVRRTGDLAVVLDGKHAVSLRANGKVVRPKKTVLIDSWSVGGVTFEVHLVLYEVYGKRLRLARALKRRP